MKFAKKIFLTVIFLAIWLAIAIIGTAIYYSYKLPPINKFQQEINKPAVELFYSNHQKLLNFGEEYGQQTKYNQLPQHLINAVIATEDRRFFSHFGFDIIGIIRAIFANHEAGKVVQGGSTITQQLAKMTFLTPEKTIKRKIQEILIAIQLEQNFTKEQILTFYLNKAYFGSGNYGIANAAKYYFNKEVKNLNLAESAMLAGMLKAPSKLSPKNNPKLANERKNLVINNLISEGYIEEKNVATANKMMKKQIISVGNYQQNLYFIDWANQEISNLNFKPHQYLAVTTTLNKNLQDKIIAITQKFIEQNQKILSNKKQNTQIAIVAIENKSGAVRALIGGKNYQESQFNRVIHAKRQSGSAFKTILYAAAFEAGMNIDDKFEDKKVIIGNWEPQNYNQEYEGEITLEQAFANSSNSVAAQIGQIIGNNKIIQTAQSLQITSKFNLNDATITLGTAEISPIELTNAFAIIANNGNIIKPYIIEKITNHQKNIIFEKKQNNNQKALSDSTIEKLKTALNKVITNGTAKNSGIPNNFFGKTGTTQNFRDAWFIGFNNEITIGIWMGNDNNSPTKAISGATLPAKLFGQIAKEI